MALVVNDRVKETSTTTGTVTFNLDGAVTGFETFSSAIGNGNTTYYAIEIPNTTEFEVGLGTIAAGTLARTTVISSSNSDALVNFSAGTKNVFCTLPASKAVIEDASNNVTLPADLTVDTNTLHVDSSNNRVGINTTSPTQALTIDGGNLAKIQFLGGGFQSIYYGDSGSATAAFVHYDHSSDNYQVDVSGTITLDAPTSIKLSDNGTQFGQLEDSSNDFVISSVVSDKDLIFKGNDGGSTITALTLDMSEAGAATFNDKVILGANKSIEFGDAGETISGDGTDLTIASSNKIILNADGAGQVFFKDGGTNLAKLFVSSQVFTLETIVSDGDFAIKGNDNGSSVTALTLDMSEAGAATFNDKIILGANKAIEFGDAGESISGDGTDMTITGNIVKIDAANRIILDAAENRIDLHDNGSEFARFVNNGGQLRILTGSSAATAVSFDSSGAATFNDKVILGANKVIEFGDAGETISGDGTNLTIASSGFFLLDVTGNILLDSANNGFIALRDNGTSYINFSENSGNAILNTPINDGDFFIKGNDGGSEITALTLDMSEAGAATFNSTITADSGKDVILGKNQGTNFTNSLLVGHATTGTLNSAENNTGVGISALDALTSGDSNVAIGTNAGSAVTTGALNVFIGTSAGAGATDMQGCIAIGSSALGTADPGNNNIAIGESAGKLITGVRNLVIGENAGDNITSGSGNVIIGSAVDPSSATDNRQLIIAGNDGSTTTTWISGDNSGNITIPGTVTANGETLSAGVSAGFAVAMSIAL